MPKAGITGGWRHKHRHWLDTEQGIKKDVYQTPLYLQRYPGISTMLDDKGRNYASRLAFIDSGIPIVQKAFFESFSLLSTSVEGPGAPVPEKSEWKFPPESDVVLRLGFRAIPVAEIGLYPDSNRATWPVKTQLSKLPDWRRAEPKH